MDKCIRNKGKMPNCQIQVTWIGTKPPPDELLHDIGVNGVKQTDAHLKLTKVIKRECFNVTF